MFIKAGDYWVNTGSVVLIWQYSEDFLEYKKLSGPHCELTLISGTCVLVPGKAEDFIAKQGETR